MRLVDRVSMVAQSCVLIGVVEFPTVLGSASIRCVYCFSCEVAVGNFSQVMFGGRSTLLQLRTDRECVLLVFVDTLQQSI